MIGFQIYQSQQIQSITEYLQHQCWDILLFMDLKEEEWIADKDEKTEANETSALIQIQSEVPSQQLTEAEDIKEEKEDVVGHTMGQQTEEMSKFYETVCIDDSNIVLIGLIGRKLQLQGRLKVTNYTISYLTSNKTQEQQVYFQMPIGYLTRCDRSVEDKNCSSIQFWLKYGCSFKIRYGQAKSQISSKTHKIINKLIETSPQFPLQYGATVLKSLRCTPFDPQFPQLSDSHSYQNDGWKKYPNYPQKFKVPLPYLSKSNPEERLVVLSFVFNTGKQNIGVWRSGAGRPDPSEDEWVGKSRTSSKLYILEIKNKGIGTSKSLATKAIELQGMTQLRDSFANTFRIAYHNHEHLKWLSNLNQTKWLEQIGVLLLQASNLVNKILNEPAQITILADTEIRGAQLTVLTQILLFPECRTVKGLGHLLQRQVLQWGSTKSVKKQGELEKGAGIIQLLDAIFQLTSIFPLSFQFSQNYLVFLAQNVYSNRFGNFLLATRSIKEEERQTLLGCCSIWLAIDEWLKDQENACIYLNPFYVDFKQCDIYELKQYLSAKHLKIWNGFFFKKLREKNADYHIFSRYQQLYSQHYRNKRQTEQLRKQLSEQHKVLVQRRILLKQMKSLE